MDWLFTEYWPFWVGAPAFALLIVGMWQIERRLLGVSGTYTAALTPELTEDRALNELASKDPAALDDALRKATVEAFGEEAVQQMEQEQAQKIQVTQHQHQEEHQHQEVINHQVEAQVVSLMVVVQLYLRLQVQN